MELQKLKKIINESNLSKAEIAEHLFPSNKYPKLALNRVLKGDGSLNSEQVEKLASLVGISINEAYSGEWKMASKKGVHTFVNSEYKAELYTKTWTTKIFHKKSLFHEAIIHTGEISLKAYISKLNNIILNHIKLDKNEDKSN